MNDSMAQPRPGLAALAIPGWKGALSWGSAIVVAAVFLVSGIWKLGDVQGAAMHMSHVRVPESMSEAVALIAGTAETLGGVFILVPRFRRLGAILTAVLLAAFMVFIGFNYNALRGEDCSCFPFIKRMVGPGFFVGDGIILVLACAAGIWSKRISSARSAFLVAAAVSVFALVSYGAAEVRQFATPAPATITVEGRPFSLATGRSFLFFFNPGCSYCAEAAKRMSRLDWGTTQVVAVPVENPQWARQFLNETGLPALVSSDFEKLKTVFGYKIYPFGIVLDKGRRRATLTKFTGAEPIATLKELRIAQ